ncbi:hypothetical protein V6N13_056155 [Hibiscus sabdariffa]|uniref:Uncharacterized protein n=1 Tax=Hibiscus sabdariffa TaxID=183260 RepID=A0ABR2BCI2_9ROSI
MAAKEKTMQQEPAKLQIQSETGFRLSPAPSWTTTLQQSNNLVQSPSAQRQPESQLSWPLEVYPTNHQLLHPKSIEANQPAPTQNES